LDRAAVELNDVFCQHETNAVMLRASERVWTLVRRPNYLRTGFRACADAIGFHPKLDNRPRVLQNKLNAAEGLATPGCIVEQVHYNVRQSVRVCM
jgi:hypothetical protein